MWRPSTALIIAVFFVLQSPNCLPFVQGGTPELAEAHKGDEPSPTGTTVFPWPMHLHDALHNAFSSASAPQTSDVLWYNFTGWITYSSPAIADGMVFIGASNWTGTRKDFMFAFYQNNGTLAWKTQTTTLVAGGEGFSSSPAYDSGYVVFGGDRIYCLYANNGTVKWSISTGNQNWGDGSPTIADGKVFIGGSNWKVYNIELETGNVLWTFQTGTSGSSNWGLYPAPAVWNGHVYAAGGDGYVYQIKVNQPGPTAFANHSFNTNFAIYSSPVIFNGRVYVGNGYTFLRTANRFFCLDAIDLSLIWEFYPGSATSFLSSAGIAYDMLFIGSVDGNLYVLDPYGSGGSTSVIWQYYIGPTWSSPAIADNQVFIGSKSNYVYAFNVTQPGPPNYKWRFDTGGNVDSSPAVADGMVFVGTHGGGGRIYCFGQLGDITPPLANSYSPTGTGVANDANFVVQWSEPMDWTSVEDSFSFTDGSTVWDATDGTFAHFPPTTTSVFDPSFNLAWDTTYWVTFNASATDLAGNPLDGDGDGTGGDNLTWYFTTAPPPDNPPILALWQPGLSPGQSYAVGDLVTILWSANDDNPWPNGGNVVNLSYGPSPAGGTPIAQYELEDGVYDWDTSGVSPGTYYVNVTVFDSIGQVSTDYSNNSFDIVLPDLPPRVSAWEPGGTSGQTYVVGEVVQVEWTASDDNVMPANNINITYGDGTTWNDVVRDTANDGIESWDTSGTSPGSYYINISAYDSSEQASWDLGNFTFEIIPVPNSPPEAVISQPSGGESWSGGASTDIVWTMTDDLTAEQNLVVRLNYSYSGGGGTIAGPLSGLTCPCSYPWTLPLIDATDVVVEIDVADEGGAVGMNSSSQFEVDSTPPQILLTVPQDGESDVARSTNVQAQWNEGMNQSATVSSFELFDNSTWLPIPGTTNWFGDTFIFDPDTDLAGDSWYTANFTTLARDDSNPGNSLVLPYSWSFRTAPVPDMLAPEIADVQAAPSPQEVHFAVNVSAVVTDDFSLGAVYLNVSGPSGVWNVSMLFDGVSRRYYIERSYDAIGIHMFTIWTEDSSGNTNSSAGQFEIVDTTQPTIQGLTVVPPNPEVFAAVNISANVQDNYLLSDVWIDIAGSGNFTMQYDATGGRFFNEQVYGTVGTVDFWIWAADTSGNWNGASGSFLVEDRTRPLIVHTAVSSWSALSALPVEAAVTDNYQVSSVKLAYTDVNSTPFNVTMTTADGVNYSYLVPAQGIAGVMSYFIWAGDTSGNENATSLYSVTIVLEDDPPEISGVSADPSPQEVNGIVNVSATVTDDYAVQVVFMNVTFPDFSWSNDTMSHGLGDLYFRERTYSLVGSYSFTVWARDTSGKWNSSAGGFAVVDTTPPEFAHEPSASAPIGAPVEIGVSVRDNYFLLTVSLNYTDVEGGVHNVSMDWVSADLYSYIVQGQPSTGNLTYFFWAVDSEGNEAVSTMFATDIIETRPLPPDNVAVTAQLRGALRLQWTAPTQNEDGSPLTDLRGFNIYRMAESQGQPTRVNLQVVQTVYFLDEGLEDGKTYYYIVRAVNSRGLESADSDEAQGTTPGRSEDDYTLVLVSIVVVILIVVVVILLLAKRGRPEDEEETAAAEDTATEESDEESRLA